jgi:hypothetical protein
MHYGGHLREAFCDWIANDCPADAELEVDYELVTWPAERFLRQMVRCSDILPGSVREDVEAMFPRIAESRVAGTYGSVARWLLKTESVRFASRV